ncbi:MAG: bifunctional 4-hydroxy-2-oxoglutarate aldolase/2-dehydro-3-deoxy-phosphogluconate aldolase [Synechococcales cyanobacterium]
MTPWLEQLRQHPLIVVIRAGDPETAWDMAMVAIEAGCHCLEITCTTPGFDHLITDLRGGVPDIQVGAGTVTDAKRADTALLAGSQFLVSPIGDPQVIQAGAAVGIPVISGALTPQEIWQVWQLGAAAVKVFPVVALGGVSYIRHVRAPLPDIPLIPTGGVTCANAPSYLAAGAVAVALGSQLYPDGWQDQRDFIRAQLQQVLASLPPPPK